MSNICTDDLRENGAREGRLVKTQWPPDLDEWRDHHAEAEHPDEGDHQPDVQPGKDPRVVGVAGDQNVPEISRKNRF